MTTRGTIEAYFDALFRGAGWERFLAEDIAFRSYGTPPKRVAGKPAFLESTRRFYAMIDGFEVRRLLVDGGYACALTRYTLRPPGSDAFTSDVAELFAVEDGRITSFEICFDSAPYSADR